MLYFAPTVVGLKHVESPESKPSLGAKRTLSNKSATRVSTGRIRRNTRSISSPSLPPAQTHQGEISRIQTHTLSLTNAPRQAFNMCRACSLSSALSSRHQGECLASFCLRDRIVFFLKGEEGKLRQTGGERELDREEMHKKRKKKYFPLITSLSELRFICHKWALRHTASHQSDSNQKLAFSSCLFTHSVAHQTQWIYDRTVWTTLPMFFHQLRKIKALIMQRDSHRLSVYIFVEHNYGWAIYRSIFWEYLHLRFSCTVLTKVS